MLTNVVKIIDLDGTNVVKIAKKAGWRKRDGRNKNKAVESQLIRLLL